MSGNNRLLNQYMQAAIDYYHEGTQTIPEPLKRLQRLSKTIRTRERLSRVLWPLQRLRMENISRSETLCNCGQLKAHYQLVFTVDEKKYSMCPVVLALQWQRINLNSRKDLIEVDVVELIRISRNDKN